MRNLYGLLADLVVTVHALYVAVIVIGLLLILLGWMWNWSWIRNAWFRVTHLAMMAVVVVESLLGITCPLTTWEYDLRTAAGQRIDEASFIAKIAHQSIFFEASPATFTVIYVTFFGLLIAGLILAPPRWRPQPSQPAGH